MILDFKATQFLPFTAKMLFEIAATIEDYPQFIPWVRSVHRLPSPHLVAPHDGSQFVNSQLASVQVGFGYINVSYCCKVVSHYDGETGQGYLIVTSDDPLFDILKVRWDFGPKTSKHSMQSRNLSKKINHYCVKSQQISRSSLVESRGAKNYLHDRCNSSAALTKVDFSIVLKLRNPLYYFLVSRGFYGYCCRIQTLFESRAQIIDRKTQ